MPAAPAVSCALCIGRTHTSNNEYTGTPGIPARNGFTAYVALSPVTGLFCHRHQRICGLSAPGWADMPFRELDASVGASGPHDFAVRSNISRQHAGDRSQVFRPALRSHCAQNAAASTASLPYVCDDHDTPLLWGGMREVLEMIWGVRKQKYFCKRDWTRRMHEASLICPSGNQGAIPVGIPGIAHPSALRNSSAFSRDGKRPSSR